MFVDTVTVHLRAGGGGAGAVSFRALRGKPKGKPDGGSGGPGGDVVIRASTSVSTLLRYQRHPHHRADNGSHGSGDLQHGKRGDDLVVEVPCGTVVRDERGVVLADLVEDGQRVVVLHGGRAGKGNAALVTPHLRAPGFAEQGEYGPSATITLELKLVADVAIIGFPNAGKSTLISAVSAAKPKIADYPFTTVRPHLGVVAFDDRELIMADIPGLIEGASEGRGLGKEFLRHTERARVLLVLLDPVSHLSIADQLGVLVEELRRHDPALAQRPRVVAVSKIDVKDPRGEVVALEAQLGDAVYPISAVRGDGLPQLLGRLADVVASAQREAPQRPGYVLHRPAEEGFEVHREGDTWVVTGRSASRAVALSDLTLPEAAATAARRLARLGVDEALRAAGALPGDHVRIGDLVFEFHEEEAEVEGD